VQHGGLFDAVFVVHPATRQSQKMRALCVLSVLAVQRQQAARSRVSHGEAGKRHGRHT
jgi:hypothetical protein